MVYNYDFCVSVCLWVCMWDVIQSKVDNILETKSIRTNRNVQYTAHHSVWLVLDIGKSSGQFVQVKIELVWNWMCTSRIRNSMHRIQHHTSFTQLVSFSSSLISMSAHSSYQSFAIIYDQSNVTQYYFNQWILQMRKTFILGALKNNKTKKFWYLKIMESIAIFPFSFLRFYHY